MRGGFEDRITEGRVVGAGLFAETVWQEMEVERTRKEKVGEVRRKVAALRY